MLLLIAYTVVDYPKVRYNQKKMPVLCGHLFLIIEI